ncbi:MAG: 2-C-methyl-D-erythritol 4-phosphate cytidylyltransferase [Fluviicola sp.]|nr:2-C-methyl-D-erythritol 4-phosphate cytidylyltransferase [Fluviicola sp.]
MSKYSIIITAGGIGKRMGSSLPKQFIAINDKPLLMHTIEKFYHFDPKVQIVITLPEEWREYWEALIADHNFKIPHRVVAGGKERFHSIKNALEYCYGDYISIHDGVRPLVSHDTMKNCVKVLHKHDAVIPVIAVVDSMRMKNEKTTKAVDRTDYLLVQTPQCFKKEVITAAYEQQYHKGITDDASLVEEAGYKIKTVEGNIENIKITNQSDLKYAGLFLK